MGSALDAAQDGLGVAPNRFSIQAYQPVDLEPLDGVGRAVKAHALSLTGHDMELVLDRPLACGTSVRVQARDWLMLGEVLYCVPERTLHRARLRLEHALPGMRELTDMSRRFLGQTARDQQVAPSRESEGYS
jgi:hypothetical protein